MPVPQENSLFVEQASCLLLILVQYQSWNRLPNLDKYPVLFRGL